MGDRLRLRHRARSPAWGSGVATGSSSTSTGPTARRPSSACQTRGFPNLFFPGGPHAAAGNNPRYNGDQVDFLTDLLVHAREHGYDVIEVSAESEERWTRMVDKGAARTTFGTIGQYVGSNIPGKPRRYLLNAGGRMKLFEIIADVVAHDYDAFELSQLVGRDAPTAQQRRTCHLSDVPDVAELTGIAGTSRMRVRRWRSGSAVSRRCRAGAAGAR